MGWTSSDSCVAKILGNGKLSVDRAKIPLNRLKVGNLYTVIAPLQATAIANQESVTRQSNFRLSSVFFTTLVTISLRLN